MINLNINFYLDENYVYSYLFLYIRTAKCVVIMLRNEFIYSNTLCIVATCMPKTGKTCYPADLLPLIIFLPFKQKWGNWGTCGELFPRNWGNVRLNKQIIKCY